MTRTIAAEISSLLTAIKNCETSGNNPVRVPQETLNAIARENGLGTGRG